MSDAAIDSHEAPAPTRRGHGWELVKTRDFGFLFAGQTISQIGDSLNKVALLWFVYEMTGSALKMTVVGLLQTLPPAVWSADRRVFRSSAEKARDDRCGSPSHSDGPPDSGALCDGGVDA